MKTLTDPLSIDMLNFEQQIAYFFSVPEPQKVAKHYLNAVMAFEKGHNQVLPHLCLAYQEIQHQRSLQFDVEKAAELELSLLLGTHTLSFEEDYEILLKIYETVFKKTSSSMLKAAMVRAFLYKYKTKVFQETKALSAKDQKFILALAKESEDLVEQG